MNDKQQAMHFATSVRGQYIISQALCVAIETMKTDLRKYPINKREISNISDMEYLRDELFPIYKAVQALDDAVRSQ